MGNFIDLTGQRFGKWMVLSRAPNNKRCQARWHCRCVCGKKRILQGADLRTGHSKGCLSCHIKRIKTKHGLSRTKLYWIWQGIVQRCENPNNKCYKNYGDRGIKVCIQWHNHKDFMTWALAHGYKEGLSIDRIDNDGNYKPGNCRFVTAKEQNRNSRNNRSVRIGKETKLLVEWAEQAGINKDTLKSRVDMGWPEHRLLEPANRQI